ncbi:DUF6332 family protein [Streptomyces bullii]|uniref:DUF6332 family protein n=1 Tax=Streptomyces bullii TaxID=349910 RepID=A0ABW0UJN2_9ACTN
MPRAGSRTPAERDAITVEIGYALCSAAFAAAVLFGAVAGPALLFDLPDGVDAALRGTGTGLAAVLFAARVVNVLVRFRHQAAAGEGRPGSQPSQPGRTNPDS